MTVLTSLRSSTDVLPVHKWNNTFTCKGAPPDNVPRELILPIVLVRDPFRWMQSIVRFFALQERVRERESLWKVSFVRVGLTQCFVFIWFTVQGLLRFHMGSSNQTVSDTSL